MLLQSKLGKGEKFMNKEEILAKSRKESTKGDEWELSVKAKAGEQAALIGILLCVAINMISNIVFEKSNIISVFICSGIELAYTLPQAIATKKLYLWLCSAIWAACFVGFGILWVLELMA
jgi:hypothetical protein